MAMDKNMFLWSVMRVQWREGKEKNIMRERTRAPSDIDNPVMVRVFMVE